MPPLPRACATQYLFCTGVFASCIDDGDDDDDDDGDDDGDDGDDDDDDVNRDAVRDFQAFAGLPATGVLDTHTAELMETPRCNYQL